MIGTGVSLTQVAARQKGALPASVFPSRLAIPPSLHFHPNTSAMTFLGGQSTVTFNASNGSGNITVTALTGSSIKPGMEFTGPPTVIQNSPIRILTQVSSSESGGTLGGRGVYSLTDAANANVTGATGTCDGTRVITSITSLVGGYVAVPLTTGLGPILETDLLGVKYIVQSGQTGSANGPGYPLICDLGVAYDTHHYTWFGAVQNCTGRPGWVVNGLLGWGSLSSVVSSAPWPCASRRFYHNDGVWTFTGAARNRMLSPANLHIFGISMSATTDPGNASSTGTYVRFYNNENTALISNANFSKVTTNTTILIGGSSATQGSLGGRWYELVGYLKDELAPSHTTATRVAETATNADAVRDVMVANHGCVPFTKGIITTGDSRTAHDEVSTVTMASELCKRGSATALPANVRVLSCAFAGQGTQKIYAAMQSPYSIFDTTALLGGGNDHVLGMWGANDIGSNLLTGSPQAGGAGTWPATNTTGATTARADEVFDNQGGTTSLDSIFTASLSASAKTIAADAPTSGLIQPYAVVTYSGSAPGLSIQSNGSGNWTAGGAGTYSLGIADAIITLTDKAAGTPMVAKWGTIVRCAQIMLDRGCHYTQLVEPSYSNTSNDATINQLRSNVLAKFTSSVTPQSGRSAGVWETRYMMKNGLYVFGADWVPSSTYYIDGIHFTKLGTATYVSGGDTPTLGMAVAAMRPW